MCVFPRKEKHVMKQKLMKVLVVLLAAVIVAGCGANGIAKEVAT